MRLSFLILAVAACAKPLAGQLPIRAVGSANETAPATDDTAPAANESKPSPVTNATGPSGNWSNPVPVPVNTDEAQAGAAALDALVKRRLPSR